MSLDPGLGTIAAIMAPMPYKRERQFFTDYRRSLNKRPDLASDIVESISTVLAAYNSSVWENRFIVGGVVEQIIGSSARAMGLQVANAGKQNQGYDLKVGIRRPVGISVKGQFNSKGSGNINLVNVRKKQGKLSQDEAVQRWSSATMFVIAGIGIGYADNEQVPHLVQSTSDAVQIKVTGLRKWWEEKQNQCWLIELPVPLKPKAPAVRVASDTVATYIFADFPTLKKYQEDEI